jgi:uncharacterized protein with PQ loop repeat
MAGNVFVQVSPFPQVKRWERRKCTGESDSAPYVSIAFGGWQWCFYGTFAWLLTSRNGFLILVHSNFLGALLGTYYSVAFFKHCRNHIMLQSFQRYLSAVTSLVVLQMCAIFVLPAGRALFLTGLISSFCSFVGAMSVLVTVPTVLKLKDSRSLPGPLVCANFVSATVWCICGWMLQDPLVYGPNIVSMLTSGGCLYLKKTYPSPEQECHDEEEKTDSAGLVFQVSQERLLTKAAVKAEGKGGDHHPKSDSNPKTSLDRLPDKRRLCRPPPLRHRPNERTALLLAPGSNTRSQEQLREAPEVPELEGAADGGGVVLSPSLPVAASNPIGTGLTACSDGTGGTF